MRYLSVFACLAIGSFCFGVQPAAQPTSTLTAEQQEVIRQALGLPPGATITLETTRTRDGGSLTVEEEATGQGASLRAHGEKIVSDFSSTSPQASLGMKGSAAGGDTDANTQVIGGSSLWKNPLLWVGIFCCLLAAGSMFVRPPAFPVAVPIKATAVIGGVGVCFICAALFPVLSLILVAAGVAIAVSLLLYREYQHRKVLDKADSGERARNALRSVAAGISDFKRMAQDPSVTQVPPEMWERLKGFISSHLTTDEEAVISQVRREDGLR